MILTYFNEICEKPAEAGSTCPDLKMFGNQWNIPEILICFLCPNKYNECQSVDANLDPDYILGSPQFCFINCSTGLCFAQYCILNCRQPDKSEKATAPHSRTLAWKIPWMEEPGRLQSMGVAKSWTRLKWLSSSSSSSLTSMGGRGILKISLMNHYPSRIWAKMNSWGSCRQTLTNGLLEGTLPGWQFCLTWQLIGGVLLTFLEYADKPCDE